jgi:L-seryl-tRNA(Ser) seleniumtransferase
LKDIPAVNDPQQTQLAQLSQLPSIDRLLNATAARELLAEYGRDEVKRVARQTLGTLRDAIRAQQAVNLDLESICFGIRRIIEDDAREGIRRVFNLSGTLLHTNLGRALLPETSIDAVTDAMRACSTLEYDLASGRRGERDGYVESLLCRLTGAEAATIVNNNAAAVMLLLNSLALDREVPVSRGELVEIGGSFRIPDIIERSGCRLVEVGTTNRTHRSDFAAAITAQTALVLKVHQSNYVIQGFTAAVDERELAGLCKESGIPFVVDLGSGALLNLEDFGLPHEPTPMEALARGADLVTFSGDKMLGGPQAGIIVGRRELIEKLNANPMKRALRCDKMTIAALAALLKLYQQPQRIVEELPLLRMMGRSVADIRDQAQTLVAPLTRQLAGHATVRVIDCESEIGSGALPDHTLPSVAISLRPLASDVDHDQLLEQLALSFRKLPVPVIGRLHKGEFLLDCRCLEDLNEFSAQLDGLDPGT